MPDQPVRVQMSFECGHVGGARSDVVEIGREEWNGMSPKERRDMLDEMADAEAANYFSWGWGCESPDDEKATDDR